MPDYVLYWDWIVNCIYQRRCNNLSKDILDEIWLALELDNFIDQLIQQKNDRFFWLWSDSYPSLGTLDICMFCMYKWYYFMHLNKYGIVVNFIKTKMFLYHTCNANYRIIYHLSFAKRYRIMYQLNKKGKKMKHRFLSIGGGKLHIVYSICLNHDHRLNFYGNLFGCWRCSRVLFFFFLSFIKKEKKYVYVYLGGGSFLLCPSLSL